ncbi:MAG: hypothetical protein D6706_11455 [Chloroflexi bacterium]|nr:MAG: hypothetical protein D6706_11455 [Chloroflexota bacterium]
MNEAAAQPFSWSDKENETTPGQNEEIKWEIVARMPGLTPALILAGRLHAEGIPARAWQEGAGQALGLTVGLLGTGYVAVPEQFVEQAREILADEQELPDDNELDWDDWEEE